MASSLSPPHSLSSQGIGDHRRLFQDTVPLDDAAEYLHFDTEMVCNCCSDGDFGLEEMSECCNDIVLDSEDERICEFQGNAVHQSASGVKGTWIGDESANGVKHHQEFPTGNSNGSDEPGVSSQDDALYFVDHFLSSNDVGISSENDSTRCVTSKLLSPVLRVNGPQSLAKHLEIRRLAGQDGTFEWGDDELARHDSCSKRVDACFVFGSSQERSIIRYQNVDVDSKSGSNSVNVCKEQSVEVHEEVIVPSKTDSTAAFCCLDEICRNGQVSEMNFEDRCVKKPDKHLHLGSSEPDIDVCCTEGNAADEYNLGFNTQMAAEVIEALSHCPSDYKDASDAYQGQKKSHADSSTGVTKSKFFSRSPNETASTLEDTSRVYHRRMRHARGESKPPIQPWLSIPTKRKRSKLLACKKPIFTDGSSTRKSPNFVAQRKREENVGFVTASECKQNARSLTSTENISPAKKETYEDQLENGTTNVEVNDNIGNVGVITYRRKRKHLGDEPSGVLNTEENCLITYRRKRKHLGDEPSGALKTGGKCKKPYSNTSRRDRNAESGQQKNVSFAVLDLTSFLKLDALDVPKRRRMHRKIQVHSSGVCDQHNTLAKVDGERNHKKSYNKNLPKSSLLKEFIHLGVPGSKPYFTWKDLRKRKHMAFARVLFSQHLVDNIIKMQKKIAGRLGISIASSLTDATHFIADKFARTRNMLEAIALGKPVVTRSWLESCGQAGCLIDERNHILRDSKKEKEIGFSLPASLASASQRPLLKGQKVLITPNIKPDIEMVSSLVKAAHGQVFALPYVVERSQIFAEKILDDLLILSCKEDHALCVPFINKGAAIYSSELLLNGIVIQKLEFERHELFNGCIKRNRIKSRRS